MLPASNSGVGNAIGFPDTCNTPTGTGVDVPTPYTNTGTNAINTPAAYNILTSVMPQLNQTSLPATTNGMEAGVTHPAGIMKPGGHTSGNPMIMSNGVPSINLCMTSQGNAYNNPSGTTIVPSLVNVLYNCVTTSPAGAVVDDAMLADLQAAIGEVPERGIGASLDANGCVTHVRRFGAADIAGLCPGDRLEQVDGEDAPGSDLRITFTREGTAITRVVQVPVPDSRPAVGAMLAPAPGSLPVGWIAIQRFQPDLPQVVARELTALLRDGAAALVLDLRNCPGGELETALQLADSFLPAGLPLATGSDGVARRSRGPARFHLPLALLVNSQTASAAELFAGCLHSHARARLIGSRTFGKGVAFTLTVDADLQARWTPIDAWTLADGRDLANGLAPDMPVPDDLPSPASLQRVAALLNDPAAHALLTAVRVDALAVTSLAVAHDLPHDVALAALARTAAVLQRRPDPTHDTPLAAARDAAGR